MLTLSADTMAAFVQAREADYVADWQSFFATPAWDFARGELAPERVAGVASAVHHLLAAEADYQAAAVLAAIFCERLGYAEDEVLDDVKRSPATGVLLAAQLDAEIYAALGIEA